MIQELSSMTLGELAGGTTLLLVAAASLVEVSPIKFNPLSWLAQKIGRAMKKEVIDKVDRLERNLSEMKAIQDERDAKSARTRVLRFGDELLHDVCHSKEHFDNILQDIREYENYCDEHPKFENDRMQLTAQLIKDTYRRCMEKHTFL